MQKYVLEIFDITPEGVQQSSDCAAITFKNYGTATLVINDAITLAQNEWVTFSANQGEVDVTKYRTTWRGAGTTNGVVIRKMYC